MLRYGLLTLLCVSLAVNLKFLLDPPTSPAPTPPAQCPALPSPSIVNVFAALSARDIYKLGQTFFMASAASVSAAKTIQTQDLFSRAVMAPPEHYFQTGVAIQMVSLPLDTPDFVYKGVERMRSHGFILVPSAITRESCGPVAAEAIQRITHPPPDAFYSSIMEGKLRKDMPLELEEPFLEILYDAVEAVGEVLLELLGPDSTLVEFSTLTSFPGATEQTPHPDAFYNGYDEIESNAPLISCYLYLVDVADDMAALDVWPGTHKEVHFFPGLFKPLFEQNIDNDFLRPPPIRMQVAAGSMVLFDALTLHRGSANTSNKTRPTLYFSMMGQGKKPAGPTFTMKKKYRGKVTLSDLLARSAHLKDYGPGDNKPRDYSSMKVSEMEERKGGSDWASSVSMCKQDLSIKCMTEVAVLHSATLRVDQALKSSKDVAKWLGEEKAAAEDCYACGRRFIDKIEDRAQMDYFRCAYAPASLENVCGVGIFARGFQ